MNARQQRELAARMLDVGKDRIWIDPTSGARVSAAITRADIRGLINSGAIKVLRKKGQSRARARLTAAQKKKGRRKGSGRRLGSANTRAPKKTAWIVKIRALRGELGKLLKAGKVKGKEYTKLYRSAGSGMLRNKAHLKLQVKKLRD